MFAETVHFPAALMAGLLSFFSPCILPLIPAYFTFISGFSLDELTHSSSKDIKRKVVLSTVAYVLGFSSIFILLGASASFLGSFVQDHIAYIRLIGGILIIILGIHLTGLIRIPTLDVEKRFHINKKPMHFLGSFVVGLAFGAGWSPCIGPLLGSILIMASGKETVLEGIALLGTYSMGLALPFIAMSFFINYMLSFLKRIKKALRYINIVAGILLILIGLTVAGDKLKF